MQESEGESVIQCREANTQLQKKRLGILIKNFHKGDNNLGFYDFFVV